MTCPECKEQMIVNLDLANCKLMLLDRRIGKETITLSDGNILNISMITKRKMDSFTREMEEFEYTPNLKYCEVFESDEGKKVYFNKSVSKIVDFYPYIVSDKLGKIKDFNSYLDYMMDEVEGTFIKLFEELLPKFDCGVILDHKFECKCSHTFEESVPLKASFFLNY
jgi:lipoate-protein ligase A